MSAIGETLKRRAGDGPKIIRIVGIRDGEYIARDAENFSAPFTITPQQLSDRYHGGSADAIEEVDENAVWLSMDRNWLRRLQKQNIAAEASAAPALRPEEKLAAESAEGDQCAAVAGPTVEPTPPPGIVSARRVGFGWTRSSAAAFRASRSTIKFQAQLRRAPEVTPA